MARIQTTVVIALVSSALFINNYCLTNSFPYAAPMMVHFGVAKHIDEAGYYAGFLGGSFMFARIFTSFLWGELSDKYGRRPILLLGCLSFFVFQLMFGFSTNFAMAVSSRLLIGFFNPLVGVAKTVAGEIVEEGQQKNAFSTLSGFASFGQILGPIIGGFLSEPAKQYPNSFIGNIELFKKYPFALPNLFGSLMSLLSALGIFFLLPETLQKKNGGYGKVGQSEEEGGEEFLDDKTDSAPPPAKKGCCPNGFWFTRMFATLSDPDKAKVAFLYSIFSFTSIYRSELLPLWFISTTKVGGMGLTISHIGTVLSVASVGMLLYQFLIFPCFSSKFSATSMTFGCTLLLSAFYFTLPLFVPLNKLFLSESHSIHPTTNATGDHITQHEAPLIPFLTLCTLLMLCLNTTAFTCINVCVNNSVRAEERGAMNGLVMSVGSLAKALGPFVSAEVFAFSVNNTIGFPLDYHLSFYLLSSVSLGVVWFSSTVPTRMNFQCDS